MTFRGGQDGDGAPFGGAPRHRSLEVIVGDRGVEGAIVGKALYAGRFTLPEALDSVRE